MKPLEEIGAETVETPGRPVEGGDENADEDEDDGGEGEGDDDEEEEEFLVESHQHDGHTFKEAIDVEIDLILEFAKGLKHQVQFRDQRMLNALQIGRAHV